jgi:transcriptional regulator with XRE-family HTH domain
MKKARTQFGLWVHEMNFTQREAAERLGLSIGRVKDYVRGYTNHTPPREGTPDLRTRLAMRAIKMGLLPWPK